MKKFMVLFLALAFSIGLSVSGVKAVESPIEITTKGEFGTDDIYTFVEQGVIG